MERIKDSFIFGIRPIEEAFKSNKEIDKLLVQKGLFSDSRIS